MKADVSGGTKTGLSVANTVVLETLRCNQQTSASPIHQAGEGDKYSISIDAPTSQIKPPKGLTGMEEKFSLSLSLSAHIS